jgi:hypothetical protein
MGVNARVQQGSESLPHTFRGLFWLAPSHTFVCTLLVVSSLATLGSPSRAKPIRRRSRRSNEGQTCNSYVGSKICAECHRSIYNSFSRTDMGRSMSTVTPPVLAELPTSTNFFDARLNRHFSVAVQQGQLYQSEWELDDSGNEVFRETERVEWLIGAGANGVGALIRRGERVFEAPLSYYAKTRTWALSPGYEDADRGFSRPIDAACIVCHSGQPNPVTNAAGQFRTPPFDELAIGCENCHGPGGDHVREMRAGTSAKDNLNPSIVNPGKLSPWLADNICMSCHQTGDGRVLQPGKTFRDFRPGQPLDQTLALLMAPPTRDSPPRSDLIQHYFSMRLSKCYRSSAEKLSCITCHNPHVQPSGDEAPLYYRAKCFICHTGTSCMAPLPTRQQTTPADNCISCHMPKRDVTDIAHASLTNHRIVATRDEPFPDATFELVTPALPDLVHLNAIPNQPDAVPPLVLLQAYGQLGVEHPEYLRRYFEVAKQLEPSEPNNTTVLEALAAQALQQKTSDGDQAAIEYLDRAIEHGSTTAWDFESLGTRLLRTHKLPEATACLRKGIQRTPYDPKLYTLLAEDYVAMNRPRQAIETLKQALQLFPEVDLLRAFLDQVQRGMPSTQYK